MENVTPIRNIDRNIRPEQPAGGALPPGQPCNIEAEQALLGAIITNNDLFASISEIVQAEHFYDPVHRGIFQLLSDLINRNSYASTVTLQALADSVPGLSELGGGVYLAKLVASSTFIHASKDYAKEVYDLARRRSLIEFASQLTEKVRKPDAKTSVSDIIDESEQTLYNLSEIGRLQTGFQPFLNATTSAVQLAKLATSRQSGLAGLPTGFTDLDNRLGGLHPSDLIIVAGRPSMGKTALATNIAFNVARNFNSFGATGDSSSSDGGHVGIFSLEMSSAQLAGRILSEDCRITTSELRRGRLATADFKRYAESARRLHTLPLFIDDTPALSIAQLATRARRLKRMQDLHLLVVDYLQLVRPTSERNSVVHEVSEVSRGLKAIAKDLDIPVIAVSQLSRQVEQREDKRPQLADLRDSGSIEQDADVVMFVYRQAYYEERKKPDEDDNEAMEKWREKMDKILRKAEVIVSKQRHGPIGTVEMTFDASYTRFGNKALEGHSEDVIKSADFAS